MLDNEDKTLADLLPGDRFKLITEGQNIHPVIYIKTGNQLDIMGNMPIRLYNGHGCVNTFLPACSRIIYTLERNPFEPLEASASKS